MRYRKKPVIIEAYQTDKELDIETLEGTMHASVGDYIITGVRGEQYPCKPDIFEQTYEPADVPTASPWHRVEEEGLPPNAKHPGAFCKKYQVMTKLGVTEGWFNPDVGENGLWDILVWFFMGHYDDVNDIDFERGDKPKLMWVTKDYVSAWREMPEPPKEDA
jgi:hypothetical protein